jgi:hypothetical protein
MPAIMFPASPIQLRLFPLHLTFLLAHGTNVGQSLNVDP